MTRPTKTEVDTADLDIIAEYWVDAPEMSHHPYNSAVRRILARRPAPEKVWPDEVIEALENLWECGSEDIRTYLDRMHAAGLDVTLREDR